MHFSHNFTNQTVKRGAGRVLMAVFCILVALMIALGAAASTFLPVYAAEYTAYDRSAIEDDLKDVDVSMYPQSDDLRHRLLDEVGFMEYAYSESPFISNNYFGLYFYVYNPSEKPVSLAEGAHHVNMATKYDENGEPSDYENVEITFLDATANNRFLKFKLSDSRKAYDMAATYAGRHDGVRRYDIAGVQLLFQGDAHATDSFTGADIRRVCHLHIFARGIVQAAGRIRKRKARLISTIKSLIR